MTVSETSSDAATVYSTDAGSERMKMPAPSGRNSSGRNANSSVAVQPTTASAIWSVAAIAASTRVYPARRYRSMFSTTTIESSTSRPSASTKPAMDSWLSENPVK